MIFAEHLQCPLIWDWCVRCKLYVSHTSGYAHPGPVLAMICRQCERTTLIP